MNDEERKADLLMFGVLVVDENLYRLSDRILKLVIRNG
jgi:hypothetical protein